MSVATAEETDLLVGFTLPACPLSVQMSRSYLRAALGHHGLGGNAGSVESVAAELVGNAVRHAGGPCVTLALMGMRDPGAFGVMVIDLSPEPPVKRPLSGDAEDGRGLHIVEALSASWGWTPRNPGKAVYATFLKDASLVRPISSLPTPDDIDADYSPQYVKLARILRDKIKCGELNFSHRLLIRDVAADYGVSTHVAGAAMETLAANRYIARPPRTLHYRVSWIAAPVPAATR